MKFEVLGPMRMIVEGQPVPLGPPKERTLLALLLIHANHVLTAERIVDALWGERPPARGTKALHFHVAGLRKTLEPNRPAGTPSRVLLTEPTGYMLRVADSDVDSIEFERILVAAERDVETNPQRTADALLVALAMWRGRPYDDAAYEEFAQPEIRRLEALHLRAEELAIDARLRLGQSQSVVADLESLVETHPLHEGFWAELMTALYRSGRQPEALDAYRRATHVLAERGTVPSEELTHLESQILLRAPALDPAHPGEPTGNLPAPLSTFVGRASERATVTDLVETHRLVTLVGAGGVGKSRLAVETARGLSDDFPDGVWLVELARIDCSDMLAPHVATVLGALRHSDPADAVMTLARHLAHRRALLVMDNCEHLVEAVAELGYTLLTRCDRIKVLATSRHPLGIEGEVVMQVPPLAIDPDADGAESEAVRLFLDRAALARPDIGRSASVRSLATQVCRQLSGIPLAIELAAARLRNWPLDRLASRIGDGLGLLSAGATQPVAHHHAMRTTLDWSYRLLTPAEGRLFRRLAVFRGGFTLGSAAALHARFPDAEGHAAELVESLVDASMILTGDGDRCLLLEPVRQYGLLVLEQHDETEAARRAHAAVLREMFRVPDSALSAVPEAVPELEERFDAEMDNVDAATRWSLASGDDSTVQELTSVVVDLAWSRLGLRETQRWCDRALALPARATPAKARILTRACFLAMHLSGRAAADVLADELARIAEELDDDQWRAAALTRRADLASFIDDDLETASRLYDQAIAILGHLDHPQVCWPLNNSLDGLLVAGRYAGVDARVDVMAEAAARHGLTVSAALAQCHRSYLAVCRGDATTARHHLSTVNPEYAKPYDAQIRAHLALLEDDLETAERWAWTLVELARGSGHLQDLCNALVLVGLLQLRRGDADAAQLFLVEALRMPVGVGDRWLERLALGPLSAAWATLDPAKGATLLEAVIAANRSDGRVFPATVAAVVEEALASLRGALDPDDLAEARTRGAALGLDAAVTLAMET